VWQIGTILAVQRGRGHDRGQWMGGAAAQPFRGTRPLLQGIAVAC